MNTRLRCIFAALMFAASAFAFAQTSIPRRPQSNARQVTFDNGVRAELVGDKIIVTQTNGTQMIINHPPMAPGGPPPKERSSGCMQLANWLASHKCDSPIWRRRCLYFFDHC